MIAIFLSLFVLSPANAKPLTAPEFSAKSALEIVLKNGNFPPISDENSLVKVVSSDLVPAAYQAYAQLPILKTLGIEIKMTGQHNINMDEGRKFILYDPELAQNLETYAAFCGTQSPITIIIAHESSHYVMDRFKALTPDFAGFVNPDEEHAGVDLIALEILKREGFSLHTIREMTLTYTQGLEAMLHIILGPEDPLPPDLYARERAIRFWLNNQKD